MKKLIFLGAMLTVASLASAQTYKVFGTPDPNPIPDDDGILNIVDKPFDPNRFIIGRDYHQNRFVDQDKGLRDMADCFFNMPDASDVTRQNFKLCEKLGFNTIVSAKGKHLSGKEWAKMSDEEIDAYVKKMIKEGGNSKSIVGYHICDEPSALHFPKLAVAVNAVKKYAPGKLATINLYPNYATLWTMDQVKSQMGTRTYKEYLEKAAEIIKPNILSYDNYMIEFSMDQKDAKKRAKYYRNLLDFREFAHKYNIPWVNAITCNQVRLYTTIPTLSNMLLQAYTSLAAGVDGIRWYTYWQKDYHYTPIDTYDRKTQTWHYLREVNRLLSILGPIIKTLKSTGVYFTDDFAGDDLPQLPGEHVKKIKCNEPLMVGEFLSKKGNRYIMIVNLSLERSARFIIDTAVKDERLFIVNTGEQKPYFQEITKSIVKNPKNFSSAQLALANEYAYWLPAGAGVLIKCSGISRTGDEQIYWRD